MVEIFSQDWRKKKKKERRKTKRGREKSKSGGNELSTGDIHSGLVARKSGKGRQKAASGRNSVTVVCHDRANHPNNRRKLLIDGSGRLGVSADDEVTRPSPRIVDFHPPPPPPPPPPLGTGLISQKRPRPFAKLKSAANAPRQTFLILSRPGYNTGARLLRRVDRT